MEVRSDYKLTEAGMIPDDWEAPSLQEMCREPITYGIVQCGPHIPNGVPYVRVSDMDGSELDVDRMLRTSRLIALRFSRSAVQEGDLVYALRGKLGEVRQVRRAVVGANLTQGTARLAPQEGVISSYLLWAMRSSRVVRQAEVEAKGTTFREITLADLRRICVPQPPPWEQRAIAGALSDVDALLGGLNRLVAKKLGLKQAAMQQLLTGQTRVPTFHREWKTVIVSDVAMVSKGEQLLSSEINLGGEVPHYNGGISPSGYTHKSNALAGTVAISEGGNSCGYVQLIGQEFWCGGHCYALVPKGIDRLFLYHALKGKQGAIMSLRVGSGLPNIQKTALTRFMLEVPVDPVEQTAIAIILSDMDAELAALESRRNKTHALKQAMMQALLTGRIRLV